MQKLSTFFAGLTALLHLFFMTFEMFLWTKPIGMKMFDLTAEFAQDTHFMSMNQGLYNGFLAAGLTWGLLAKKRDVTIFFLLCVIAAGVFGAITVNPTIFIVQAVPAILGLGFAWLGKEKPRPNNKNPKIRLSRLRDIGWKYWDRIGLLEEGQSWEDVSFADEYDSYLLQAAGMLRRGAPRKLAIEHLVSAETKRMGFSLTKKTRSAAKQTIDAIAADKDLWNYE